MNRRTIMGTVVGIVLIAAVSLAYYWQHPIGSSRRIAVANLLVNTVLTSVLIVIYYDIAASTQTQAEKTERQADLQEDVVRIQRKQTEILEAEHTPVITVNSVKGESFGFHPDGVQTRGEWLWVKLSNLGNEVAVDLRATYRISYDESVTDISISPISLPLGRDDMRREANFSGGMLEAGATDITFFALAGFSEGNFENALALLYNDGVEEVEVGVILQYKNLAGKEFETGVCGFEIALTEASDQRFRFPYALERGAFVPIGRFMEEEHQRF